MTKHLRSQWTISVSAILIGITLIAGKASNHRDTGSITADSSIVYVKNINGHLLGYARRSGVSLLTIRGLTFKDPE